MSIIEFLSQPFWQRLSLTLIHFIWQGLTIVTLISICIRVFKPSRGNIRYTVYLLAFAAMIVCPIATFIAIDIPISPDVVVVIEAETGAESAEFFDIPSDTILLEEAILPVAETSIPVIPTLTPVTNTTPIHENVYSYMQNTMPWLLIIWMVGVIIFSIRLLMGFFGVHRWRNHLEPLPEKLVQRISSLSEKLGMSGFTRVFISPSVLQAMAVGYLRPMVLLPASLVMQMPSEMIEAVIAHELAHIRRFDLWVNLAQRVMEALLFYHPAVWWLSGCLRSEREICCDELAVRATGERLTYASTLESIVRAKFIAKQPVLAQGLSQDNKPILQRVRHILGLAPAQQNSSFWPAGVITVLFFVGLSIPATLSLNSIQAAVNTPSTWDLVRQSLQERPQSERIIHFPNDRSIGSVWIGELNPSHWNIPYGAPYDDILFDSVNTIPAQGEVTIPAGKYAGLFLDPWTWENPQNLSVLQQFEPDEFYFLSFDFNRLAGESGPDDRCMPYIAHLTGLKRLELGNLNITARGLEYLSEFESLERLSLPEGITDAGMVQVGKVTTLRDISTGHMHNITNVGLKQISNLKALEHLFLYSCRITDEGLSVFSELPNLHRLRIHGDFTSDAIAHLQDAPSLKYLWIVLPMFEDEGMKHIAGITPLEGFKAHVVGSITDEGVEYIKDMPNLKYLEFDSAELTDRALIALKELSLLECLVMPSSGFTDEGMANITELKNLKILRLGGYAETILTDKSLDYIGELENLEELMIEGAEFTDEGMQNLAKFTKLRMFIMSGSQNLTNKSFEALSGLTNLTNLGFAVKGSINTNINDDGLKHLSNLTALEDLQIYNCCFTDDGLQYLEGLTSLKRIMGFNGISDEAMAQFREKMPGL